MTHEEKIAQPIGRGAATRTRFTPAFAACLFLMIVGAKWATFDRFGSPMPDWDQWDAEALEVYIPWFENDHFFTHLFRPHNEHRVILTKLQSLGLTLLNGQWDSRLEAVTNAMLHATLAIAFWCVARRWVAPRWRAVVFILVALLFGLPLAWQNVLGGFHSQQYWLLALSFGAIVALPFARPWSVGWVAGAICAVLALGSMGSGFLAAAVVLVLLVWRIGRREATLRGTWPTSLLALALVIVGISTRVEVWYHQQLKAKTAHDFIFSILRSLEWPLRDHDWAGAILWLPWAIVTWRVISAGFRRREIPDESATESRVGEIVAALGGWVLLQMVATAYARGAGADYPASRYMDTLAFGALVNALALLVWFDSMRTARLQRLCFGALAAVWLVLMGFGVRRILDGHLRYELPDAKKYYLKAEDHMRRYLALNDPKELAYPDIPFPSAADLINRLAHQSVRALMPVPIRAPLDVRPASENSAFSENDARTAGPDHPPRAGLSPATPPLSAAVSWGSFGADGCATTAIWKSSPLAPLKSGWLKFETAGDILQPGFSLSLRDAHTDALLAEIRPTRSPGDSWRSAYVRAPHTPFVIEARDESTAGWLAFSPPVEMGNASYWAWQATKHGWLILWCAVIGTGIIAIVTVLIGRGVLRIGPAGGR